MIVLIIVGAGCWVVVRGWGVGKERGYCEKGWVVRREDVRTFGCPSGTVFRDRVSDMCGNGSRNLSPDRGPSVVY